MPYLPQGATAAHRDAFAQRLTQQLLADEARSGLMPLREAFARAGGFPDAHSAETIIQQDALWHNPLASLGMAPSKVRPAYRFLGIHPEKLFEWAKIAWRKHRPLLASTSFDGEKTRVLLASLWGHNSWDDALRFERNIRRTSPASQTRLLRANTLADLRELAMKDGRGNFRGLHMALGTTADGQWLGMGMSQALTHTMVIDEDRQRRYRVTQDWINHRINCQDGVFLVDASVDGQVANSCIRAAQAVGRSVQVFDLTGPSPNMPWLDQLDTGSLTHLLLNLVYRAHDDGETQGVMLTWLSLVATQCVAQWRCGASAMPLSIIQALADPRKNMQWWIRDTGLAQPPSFDDACNAYDRLPGDWEARMRPLRTLFSSQLTLQAANNKGRLREQVTVFRLPFLLENTKSQEGCNKVALATSLYRAWLSCGLGLGISSEVSNIDDLFREPEPLERMPFFNVHVDVPFSMQGRGDAVIFAQSRSMGSCLLRVGPSSITSQGDNSDECVATIANINTKIFHDPEKTAVVYRDEIAEFKEGYTA